MNILLIFCLIQASFPICGSMRIIFERSYVSEYDSDLLEYASSECNLINRTTRALHAIFKLKHQPEESTTVDIKFYKFMNNEYRYAPIQFKMKIKEMFNYKLFDLPSLLFNHTTPPLTWPMKPVRYEMKNFVANTQNVPNIPYGSYKLGLNFKDKNNILAVFFLFAKIL